MCILQMNREISKIGERENKERVSMCVFVRVFVRVFVCVREREFLSEKYIERDDRAHTSNEITETEQKVIVL